MVQRTGRTIIQVNALVEANFHKAQMSKLGYEITNEGFMHKDTLEEIHQPIASNEWYWQVGGHWDRYNKGRSFTTITQFLESKGVKVE